MSLKNVQSKLGKCFEENFLFRSLLYVLASPFIIFGLMLLFFVMLGVVGFAVYGMVIWFGLILWVFGVFGLTHSNTVVLLVSLFGSFVIHMLVLKESFGRFLPL